MLTILMRISIWQRIDPDKIEQSIDYKDSYVVPLSYGESSEFISAVESMPDKTNFVSVFKDTQSWLKRPMTMS